MSPIQQMLLGVGAVATKTYIDDIFSTNVYIGAGSGQVINNGIDNSSEGGMVWFKRRDGTYDHQVVDTIRGGNKGIRPNLSSAEITTSYISSFNNNGYTLGTEAAASDSGLSFAAWNFRKAPGFFDVVTYTGNDTNRTIAHSLGCVPGMILIKGLDAGHHWQVYHRDVGNTKVLKLNDTDAASTSGTAWNNTSPTATHFSLGTEGGLNTNNQEFVAYLFAGGEEGYNSVEFDGDDDYLSWAATSDFAFGTGAYTVEFWVYPNSLSNTTFFNVADTNGFACVIQSGKVTITRYGVGDQVATSTGPSIGQWTHYALVREGTGSNQAKIYKNGVLEQTGTDSTDWTVTATTGLGANAASGIKEWDGKISNFRIVKGTAVYTSAFTPPTAALTNITNTKLLCCNGDLPTSSTVTPGTITANGDPYTTGTSPFTSPDAVFGDAGDQNVIKCGNFVGNGSTNGPEVFLGWEPQWILWKNSDDSESWRIVDSMRGIPNGSGTNDQALYPNNNDEEEASGQMIDVTPTGFKITTSDSGINSTGENSIWMAIRRPDGYVGKPIETGTKAFSISAGDVSGAPLFDAGHVVDMQMVRRADISASWETGARLLGTKQVYTNTNGAETEIDSTGWKYDYMNGWHTNAGTAASGTYSWMWARHAGFDVVTYKGDGVAGRQIPHSLNKTAEMMWVKRRDGAGDWSVYHKGLNGGTNPETRTMYLNDPDAEYTQVTFNNTAPTSTHFTVGSAAYINGDGNDFIAMLFASVDGISKVGSYTGNGGSSTQTVTLGFAPRFILIKRADANEHWLVLDTTRGWVSGGDSKFIYLQSNAAQGNLATSSVGVTPTSTGVEISGTQGFANTNSGNYLYYAHA